LVPSNLCPHLGEIYEPTDQQEIIVSEDKIWNVCTIHGGSLYRKSAALKVGGFCTHFSPTGHREETLFYCRLYFAGYELKVRSSSRLWHFESIMGGSRPDGAHADTRQDARRSDESKFQQELLQMIKLLPERPVYLVDKGVWSNEQCSNNS
jgi:hypothetical protein